MKFSLKLCLMIVALLGFAFMISAPAFCYENLAPLSDDPSVLLSSLFSSVAGMKGQGTIVIIGIGLTILLAILKLASTWFKTWFDKMGNWKFLLPVILGALAELCFNMPSPFTLTAMIQVLVVGGTGSGAVSIALHHILDGAMNGKKNG